MSKQRPMEVTYTFTKVDVTYPVQTKEKRFGLRKRRLSPDRETSKTSLDTPPPESTWFDRLDILHNHGTACAWAHTIDVQPDFRYSLAYITYSARELYASTIYDHREFRVSPLTFIYYCQSLVVATLLFYDMYSRPQRSCHAASFLQDVHRSDFTDILFELKVPNFMAQILSHLCPAFDAHQPRLLYVPTLAGFSAEHDFGRIVPPGIFLAANSIVCNKSPGDADPVENLRRFYSTKLLTIAGREYYITNFLGGPYMDGDEVCDRSNWVRQSIEHFVTSGIGNAYETGCSFSPLDYTNEREINPYDVMFCFSDANYMSIVNILNLVSRFFQEKEPSSQVLGDFLSSPSGITIMSHFHALPTLPTWHSLPPPPTVYEKEHIFVDDAQFAGKVHFLSNPHGESQKNVQFSPLEFERFDRFANVRGDIFGFQPYGRDFNSLSVALTLGLTIESGDIDGVTISQPNLRLSLCENQSHLLQGALPVRVVRGYIPSFEPENRLVIFKRAPHSSYPNNPVGFARGDMGRIVSYQDGDQLSSISPADADGPCYTYMAWKRSDEVLPIPDSSVYFWSSYRFVHNAWDYDNREVYFYFTLKALYGSVVNMTQLTCPSWLFP